MKFILIDTNHTCWGPFDKATDAAAYAVAKWPKDKEMEDGINGWEVRPLREPEQL